MSQVSFSNQNSPSFKSRIVNNEEFKSAQNILEKMNSNDPDLEAFYRSLKAIKNDGENDVIEIKHLQNTDRYEVYVNGEKKEDRAISLASKGQSVIRALIRYASNNKVLPPVDEQRNLIDELAQKLQELKEAYYSNISTKTNELCEEIKISE